MKKFKAESQRLMDLMVNSIYTNKEIFLRELISNASDAIDKMYVRSLSDPSIPFDKDAFYIELIPNKEARTLTVRDTGIGMTKEELEENLGTIAHSGSLDFKQANKAEEAMNIIGQFGVGFYSAFMVAKKVRVVSRAYGSETAYVWESEGSEGFRITEGEKSGTGTEITLFLKEDENEERYSDYLGEYTLRELVRKYSNYVRYPIRMEVTKSRRVEPEKEGDEPTWEETKEVETLNSMMPIWDKPKTELTESDYTSFYHQERFGFDEPVSWIHMVADGTLSYRAILYIPEALPYDFYTKEYEKGLELYANGVKIMDRCGELLPDYYSFVKGVVSSEDLSLNISREMLQQDRQLLAISRKIEAKITDELKRLLEKEPEKYERFFDVFGTQLKAGIYQSYGMKKDVLADLLIFHTSKKDGRRTLKQVLDGYEYGADDEKQEIYYASGDSVEQIDKLPALQTLKTKGIEVLYLVDDIDEFMIRMMQGYEKATFRSVLAEDFSLEGEEAKDESEDEKQKALFEEMGTILNGEVVGVKASHRLADDAVVLVAQGDISIDMEKTFAHQPGGDRPVAQKVLEINTKHPIYEKLLSLKEEGRSDEIEEMTRLLYDQARLIEGLGIDDAVAFAKRVQKLMM